MGEAAWTRKVGVCGELAVTGKGIDFVDAAIEQVGNFFGCYEAVGTWFLVQGLFLFLLLLPKAFD